ncbi:hypothetical protein [Aliiglaciecola sp. LCG003]|uniref:hypothetical protein n=1 Tax=Aliiglaciecola sp. LCG003 TaxID=3053655 RepID=UPI0025744A5D|nr:hypothetical protein [Aliiglaciecola sp. LCG003]WJG07633.1 hypothetical protein QR722_09645 [Aliiglaciecola sp. LCG003]
MNNFNTSTFRLVLPLFVTAVGFTVYGLLAFCSRDVAIANASAPTAENVTVTQETIQE